ncbi:MAG: NAD-dependent epimerase/dehydratase family protein [Terriglobales bacterium]
MERVLITGGAGFIGSHLAQRLLAAGYGVRIFDNLAPQVHGAAAERSGRVAGGAEVLVGDVRSPAAVRQALDGVQAVVHLAAAVGVGQSMYRITEYAAANVQGTAVVLQAVLSALRAARRAGKRRHAGGQVRRLLVASSMSVYGEGAYQCPRCGPVAMGARGRAQLERQEWEALCPRCGAVARAEPTREEKAADPHSIYAVTKLAQEQMVRCFGQAYGMPAVALRFFNVYGPGQSLGNPYTGVAALFSARLLAGQTLPIYEDGGQQRDFVNVRDVARACQLALQAGVSGTFNIASGQPVTIAALAGELAAALGRPPHIVQTGAYRMGDVRHCLADPTAARRQLGFVAEVARGQGLAELAAWLSAQPPVRPAETAAEELRSYGLGG